MTYRELIRQVLQFPQFDLDQNVEVILTDELIEDAGPRIMVPVKACRFRGAAGAKLTRPGIVIRQLDINKASKLPLD